MSIENKKYTGLERTGRLIDRCPRCAKGPMVADTSGGELFCSNCGYVVKDRIEDKGLERRAFSLEERDERAHTGLPSSLAMTLDQVDQAEYSQTVSS